MKRIAPIQHNYVRYTLLHEDIEPTVINEPDNWKIAKKEISRSSQYHGMIITISDLVEFSGIAADVLEDLYDKYGVLCDARILEEERDPETDEWTTMIDGELDFSTHQRGNNIFSCKINANTLVNKFQSRWRTELNLASDVNLDGEIHGLPPTEKQSITLHDRGIQGINLLNIGSEYEGRLGKKTVLLTSLADSYYNLPIPMTVSKEYFDSGNIANAVLENLFFYNKQAVETQVKFDINFSAELTTAEANGAAPQGWLTLKLVEYDVYDNGTSIILNVINDEQLHQTVLVEEYTHIINYISSFTKTVGPNRGFAFYYNFELQDIADYSYTIKTSYVNLIGSTVSGSTTNNIFMPFPFFERFIKLMANGRLESDYLNNCRYALVTGYMLRNAKIEGELEPPTEFTFQKLYDSFDAITPIGLSASGNTIKVEAREYFYKKALSYDFGANVSNVLFSYDKTISYSEVEIGFETKDFTREDSLDEYAIKSVWTSPINKYLEKLPMVSDIQGSTYTIEKLRRIQYDENIEKTHSERGDDTLFFIHLKDNSYEVRRWQDDFSTLPLNLFRANDAYNLMLSPMNRLRSLGRWINYGLTKFTDKQFTHASSTGDSGMITQPIGKTAIGEQDSITINETGNARYIGEKVTFKIENINFNKILEEEFEDGTKKMYGLFRFIYKGENRQGFLLSYKPESSEVELRVEY